MDALLKKLNYRGSGPITVLAAPADVRPLLDSWSDEGPVRSRLGRNESFVLAFLRSAADLAGRAPKLVDALVDDGILWLAYPKKSSKRYTSDLSRDDSWQPLGDLGYEPVRQVAVDEDWSAVRFRPTGSIARLARDPSRALSAEGKRRAARVPAPVAGYLAGLPEDRRAILARVDEVIRGAAPELEPAMWGDMLGYGSYHYRYASGREGDFYVVGLASQKQYVSLYLCATAEGAYLPEANADRLGRSPGGKVSVGKSCIRFKKLEDLDLDVVAELVRTAADLSTASS